MVRKHVDHMYGRMLRSLRNTVGVKSARWKLDFGQPIGQPPPFDRIIVTKASGEQYVVDIMKTRWKDAGGTWHGMSQ